MHGSHSTAGCGALRLTEPRRHGRVLVRGVEWSLGEVVDLSASGARVRCADAAPTRGDEMSFSIASAAGPVTMRGCVIWTHRLDRKRSEFGLEFIEPGPVARAALAALVRENVGRAMLGGEAGIGGGGARR